MNWSASVLSTVTSDTEPTIVVNFDSAKYIFNVGENTNRAFLQSKRNWRKTRGIFLSSVGTQRASGLPGLLMSLADGGLASVDVVGPQGLLHFLAAMRLYAFRDSLALKPTEINCSLGYSDPKPIYNDENITVYGAPISAHPAANASDLASADISSYDSRQDASPGSKRKRTPSPVSSQKRPVYHEHRSTASNEDLSALSIQQIINRPDFVPAELDYEKAQEWRRLIVHSIFSGDKPPPNQEHKQLTADAKKGKVKKLNSTDQTKEKSLGIPSPSGSASIKPVVRVGNTPGFRKILPRYSCDLDHGETSPLKSTAAYIVVGPRVRGKFDVAKAKALGLQPGPLYGKLTKGETVTFMADDGKGGKVQKIIQPEDCMGDSESPGVLLILDTPTIAYIPSLVSTFSDSSFFAKFRSHREEDKKEYPVRAVFHLCGDNVFEDEQYKRFMLGFDVSVHHLIASREHGADPVTFTSAAFNQLRLNQLDAEMFPLPKFSPTAGRSIQNISGLPQNTSILSANILVDIRPTRAPVHETIALESDLFHPTVLSSAPLPLSELTMSRFTEALAEVEKLDRISSIGKNPGDDIAILPLGTGSAVPSKYRNVSGTLIRTRGHGNILLDAGEGSWGQLVRHFGTDVMSPSSVWKVLREMKCIFISHIHGDHHIGLAKILAMRRQLDPPPTEPLFLVANRPILLYLQEYSDVEDLGLHNSTGTGVKVILSDTLHWKQSDSWRNQGLEPWMDAQNSQRAAKDMCLALGLVSFLTVDVYHRTRCYGAVMKHLEGWSIVYSGDTMPTNNLVNAGKNATLLIHEATMADDQSELARAKGHSTFGQAVDIGRRMNATNILLTHFSARYPKMPPSAPPSSLVNEQPKSDPVLALAFDHANLTIGSLWKMKFYLPAIEQSFLDTVEADEE